MEIETYEVTEATTEGRDSFEIEEAAKELIDREGPMSPDIVERLRREWPIDPETCDEAADEIARLRRSAAAVGGTREGAMSDEMRRDTEREIIYREIATGGFEPRCTCGWRGHPNLLKTDAVQEWREHVCRADADEEAYEEEGLYRFVGGVFEPVPEREREPGEIEAYTYDCQDWGDRDKVPSTIEITVGHYHTGMVPVYVRIRPRALATKDEHERR